MPGIDQFFAKAPRKARNCPLTPATPKPERSTPSRSRYKGSISNRRPNVNGSSGRERARKTRQSDAIDSDYSTPRTTRTSLTPRTLDKSSWTPSGRPSHLVYPRLELNNESSSESNEDLFRHRKRARVESSPPSTTPLAIEAAPIRPLPTNEFIDQSPTRSSNSSQNDIVIVKEIPAETHRSDGSQSREIVSGNKTEAKSQAGSSQCITPPITPERSPGGDCTLLPKLPTFVPGSCDIKQVLKLYASTTKRNLGAS